MKPSDAIRDLDPDVVGDMVRRHLNGVYHPRARLLKLLATRPEMRIAELAEGINRSPSTVCHYLAILRSEGLEGFFGGRPHARRLTLHQREILFSQIRAGDFGSLIEIRDWVEERFGVAYTIPGVRKLVREEIEYVRRIVTGSKHVPAPESDRFRKLVTFLNALPVSTDGAIWIDTFRSAFYHLYPSLACAVILLNRSSTIDRGSRENVGVSHLDIRHDRPGRRWEEKRTVDHRHDDILAKVLQSMAADGRDPASYYPPVDFLARIVEKDWVGRILLFFPVSGPDPHDGVMAELESIRPFLTFCLSDGVIRHQLGTPQHQGFQRAVDRLGSRFRLTIREREVLVHYISGSTIDDISDDLHIAVATVRNHIYSIHRKTKTRYQRELFNLVLNI